VNNIIRRLTHIARRAPRLALATSLLVVAAASAAAVHFHSAPRASAVNPSAPMPPGVGAPGGPSTSSAALKARVAEMEQRLVDRPGDLNASVLLADALLRQARATGDSRPAGRAAGVLERTLRDNPGSYDALRLLGAVDLSLHRFAEARDVGMRARDLRPDDAWNYGVIGDAQTELGDYDLALASFDRMMQLRPGPAGYARISYAREIRGDLPGALAAMQLAYAATFPQDPEAQAWYSSQLGELLLKLGHADLAGREFRRALFVFPHYPLAEVGTGKAKLALGDHDGALQTFLDQLQRVPTLDLAARIGDLHAAMGHADAAEHYFALAEDLAGPAPSQTEALLALFLAEHDRKLPEAVTLAEHIATMRHDIVTEHALAWAYFKVGRLNDAVKAIDRATRTGSLDVTLQEHAYAIHAAVRRG
jgi:tetratricopeptide (TPR) repeat protein